MSREWCRKRKSYPYYRRAKKEGYRSRAAYKLREINNRVKILKPGYDVLDIGASPGGWSQVAREIVGESGTVVAVDLVPMPEIEGVFFIRGDIEKEETVSGIREVCDSYDAVISDASPKLSGNRTLDRGRSYALCYFSLELAVELLHEGGNCLVKIFQGDEIDELKNDWGDRFRSVERFKPRSSLKRSIEIYMMFRGFKGA